MRKTGPNSRNLVLNIGKITIKQEILVPDLCRIQAINYFVLPAPDTTHSLASVIRGFWQCEKHVLYQTPDFAFLELASVHHFFGLLF